MAEVRYLLMYIYTDVHLYKVLLKVLCSIASYSHAVM